MNIGKRALRITLINALGALLAFLLHVVLARVLGVSEYGHYIFIVAVATLLGTIAVFGFDTASMRFIAEYQEKKDSNTLAEFTRFAQSRVFWAAIAIGFLWALLASGPLRNGPFPMTIQLCGAALVVCIAYSQLHASLLQGEGRADESQAVQLLARPIIIMSAAVVLAVTTDDLDTEHLLITTAVVTILIGAWMQLRGAAARIKSSSDTTSGLQSVWGSAATSMLGLAVVNQILATGDIVLATLLLGAEDAGIYAAAVRLASVVSFATTSFNFILAPTISALFTRRDMDGLQKTVSQLTIGAILIAIPIVLVMVLFGENILALFGPEFVGGYRILLVLCIGQAVLTANGAVGFLMTMTNNHSVALRVVAMSAALLLTLGILLTPWLGLMGVALAAAIATAFRSIMLDRWVWKLVGVKAAPIAQLPVVARAAFDSVKEYGKTHLPRTYSTLHALYYPVLREVRLISKVGFRGLVRHAMRGPSWLEALPIQHIRVVAIPFAELPTLDALLEHLRNTGRPYSIGGHCVYIPPETLAATAFSLVVRGLPNTVGLKILKNVYTAGGIGYLHGPGHSPLQRAITYSPAKMVLVANLLHTHGLGPRIVDFVQIQSGETEWFAYVVEHCEGETPSLEECTSGMHTLKDLERERVIMVTVPGGYGHPDLTCPSCNGNAIVRSSDRGFQYLDFQNFVLEDYQAYLTRIAEQAVAASHFGDRSIFRGGGYLYQSIPGVALTAKRATASRGEVLTNLLKSAGISIEGKVVLDVGCNLGMMMGDYLARGAAWCHGWDRAEVVKHAERLLLSIGCTRFTVSGANLDASYDLESDIPFYLRSRLAGCVVSYLSIKGHIGWIDSLNSIPWETLIVEGHEGESLETFTDDLQAFCTRTKVRLVAQSSAKDGDSDSRHLAVVSRHIQ